MLDLKILSFSKSVTIKFNIVATYINRGLASKGLSVSSNKKEWKYYLNLAGQKHSTNSNVKIKVTETGEEKEFCLETLNKYPYTKKELLKYENMYLELLEKYPLDIEFIKGCLHPVDIDKAIDAKDGSIVAYNETFIEANEYNLIPELEVYIKHMYSRWYIKSYSIVDELYIPSFLAVLYSNIPAKIHNIRVKNIGTSRVHSFYLEHFFRSRLNLWDDVKLLNKESQFWLYTNLDYLIKNVGKNKTLNLINTYVFDTNNVGIGTYVIQQTTPDPEAGEDLTALELDYQKNRFIANTVALNNSYRLDKNTNVKLRDITQLQLLETDPVGGIDENQLEKSEYYTKRIEEGLRLIGSDAFNSKIIDISTETIFKIDPESLLDKTINIWAMLVAEDSYVGLIDYTDPNSNNSANTGKVGTVVEYVEPNSNQSFSITPKVGFLMLIKLLLTYTDSTETLLTDFQYYDIPDSDVSLDSILAKLYDDGYSKPLLTILDELLESRAETFYTPDDFKDYAEILLKFNRVSWLLDSNCGNTAVSANIKQYLSMVSKSGLLELSKTPKTIDQLLEEEDIKYDVKNNYNIYASIRELIYAFTKIRVDEYEEIRNKLIAYKNIINKLTSYTLQVLDRPEDVNNEYMVYGSTPKPYFTKNGLITPLSGDSLPFNDIAFDIRPWNIDFDDQMVGSVMPSSKPKFKQFKEPTGSCYIFPGVGIREIRPNNYITLVPYVDYNFVDDIFVDKFFLSSKAKVNPLNELTYQMGGATFTDSMTIHASIDAKINAESEELKNDVTAIAMFSNNKGISFVKPNTSAILEDYDEDDE